MSTFNVPYMKNGVVSGDKGEDHISSELHLITPREDYDFNYAAGTVRQMWSTHVFLQPFVVRHLDRYEQALTLLSCMSFVQPSEHARRYAEMLEHYPEVGRQRWCHPKSGLKEVLQWVEDHRKDSVSTCYHLPINAVKGETDLPLFC